jgi:hypothetical protein
MHLWLYSPLLGFGRFFFFFSFLIFYTVSRTPWTGYQPVARLLPTHRTAETQNRRIQTPMSQVEFESKIPAFEREKTVRALDRAPTVIGFLNSALLKFCHYPLNLQVDWTTTTWMKKKCIYIYIPRRSLRTFLPKSIHFFLFAMRVLQLQNLFQLIPAS